MSDLGPVFEGLKWKLGSVRNWRWRNDDSMRLSLWSSCPCDKRLMRAQERLTQREGEPRKAQRREEVSRRRVLSCAGRD